MSKCTRYNIMHKVGHWLATGPWFSPGTPVSTCCVWTLQCSVCLLLLLVVVVQWGYIFQSTPIFVIIVREWKRCFGQIGTNVLQKEEHKKPLNKLNHLIAEENIEINIKNVYHISWIYFCHAELVSLLVMDVKYDLYSSHCSWLSSRMEYLTKSINSDFCSSPSSISPFFSLFNNCVIIKFVLHLWFMMFLENN